MEHTTCKITFDPALNKARQSLYRFAALALLDPKIGAWEQLSALHNDPLLRVAADLVCDLPAAQSVKLGLGELPIDQLDPLQVLARLPDSSRALNEEYEKTFGLLVSAACPPYETEFINSKFTFQRSNTLADVSGFYKAFGLTISSRNAERPDHIVLELEFMAFLLGKEREAHDDDDAQDRNERVAICRDAQTRFLREHLAGWVPPFGKLLSRENRDGFYASAGAFLSSLIPAERALLNVDVPDQPSVPSPIERPDTCEGCQLAD